VQRISIENFGPINRFEADVKDVMFLIGPQVGKSTLVKLIFLFKSIKYELNRFILDASDEHLELPFNEFSKYLRKRFVDFFGITNSMQPFRIQYWYSYEKQIKFYLNDRGLVDVNFDSSIWDEINVIFENVRHYNFNVSRSQSRYLTLYEILEIESDKRLYLKSIKSHIDDLFEDTRSTVFIPSGRSLISSLANQLQDIEPYSLDLFLKSFLENINRLKISFKETLNILIEERQNLINEETNLNQVKYAARIIKKILKSEYHFQSDGERIYLNDDQYVKLQYASSGQEESVWILLLIFKYILDGTSVFVVFEEPEAHLYPETQSDIVELIGLLANINNNQIILTTHSPYILSSFNNLLYAYQIGNKVGINKEAVESIVNRNIWIDPNRTSAYFISENRCESIFDEELKLIQAEKIDTASSIINNKFNDLFRLDN
jgi:predicted ATP-dependent endonuclease of OLD family